jgi:hypothetical protein
VIRFYFHPTPNPAKIAPFLEEAGLPYEAVPVDTSKGEQHTPAYRAINPNGNASTSPSLPGFAFNSTWNPNFTISSLLALSRKPYFSQDLDLIKIQKIIKCATSTRGA